MNGEGSPRVLLVAMAPDLKRKKAIRLAAHFLDEGARVDVLTAERRGWGKLDERARLHRLDEAEARHPLPWLERAVVVRAPRLAVRPLARLGRPGAMAERVRGRLSGAVHRRLFLPFYRHVRPLLLARLARRRVLRDIDMAQVVRVIVTDRDGVPLAWRLARRHPGVTVTTRLDKSLEARG
ncbi:hypothetical protein [Actinomadura sp. K4S16]|uniref:hypothetical protein n=1 Tax=Actinomadura sp. K4S16 TaxID=1316147 RepID=UPI0011ED0B21|nr:hypothetical protein [Actinomadura sp. K4S16]